MSQAPKTPEEQLPEYLKTLSKLGGGEVVRCQTCGREGESRADLNHHPKCQEE